MLTRRRRLTKNFRIQFEKFVAIPFSPTKAYVKQALSQVRSASVVRGFQ